LAQRGDRRRRKKRQRAAAAARARERPVGDPSPVERPAGVKATGRSGPEARAEPGGSSPEHPAGGYYARSRQRDEAARAALKPLEAGERPAAVTVGAIVALFLALANFGAWLAGLEVQGDRPSVAGVVAYSGLMLLVAYGMWKAKYWAVLGMHALLAILIIVFALLAVQAENVLSLLIALAVIGSAGTLFWFLIKAMARIQMPPRPGSQPR
jgi:hypothetical protein